jgi:aryl-alcohol dehydrogenase-like predicted oxidoreductase
MDACKASLRSLDVDHIDLYQRHGFDGDTPLAEQLDTLVRHGHVRYAGASNRAAWQPSKAFGICERRNLAPIRSVRSCYILAGRDPELEIVPAVNAEGVA